MGVPNGAYESDDLDSVDECKAFCVAEAECVAFDYNVAANRCWFFYVEDDLADRRQSTGVDHYVLVSRCAGKWPVAMCCHGSTMVGMVMTGLGSNVLEKYVVCDGSVFGESYRLYGDG